MDATSFIRPLARWDGAHLVFDLEAVEGHLCRLIEDDDTIRNLNLCGAGDTVRLEADVTWKGLRARAAVEFGELRLRQRHLGLRIRRIEVLGGFPLPRWAILRVVEARAGDRAVVRTDSGIVVIDLRSSIPVELELCVLTVQITERMVDVWIGPGGLQELPRREPPRLAATGGDHDR